MFEDSKKGKYPRPYMLLCDEPESLAIGLQGDVCDSWSACLSSPIFPWPQLDERVMNDFPGEVGTTGISRSTVGCLPSRPGDVSESSLAVGPSRIRCHSRRERREAAEGYVEDLGAVTKSRRCTS